MEGAQGSYDSMVGLGVIAALLAVLGIGKFGIGRPKRSAATQSQTSARDVQAQRTVKTASNKALPTGNGASPWDTFSHKTATLPPKARRCETATPTRHSSRAGKAIGDPAGRKASKPADPVVPHLNPSSKRLSRGRICVSVQDRRPDCPAVLRDAQHAQQGKQQERVRFAVAKSQSAGYSRTWLRGLAQLVRATVSKTVGRGFEPLSPCQATNRAHIARYAETGDNFASLARSYLAPYRGT